MEPLLSPTQISRIDQIALQRMTYRAFLLARVISALQLTAAQQKQIQQAIDNHQDRIRENQTLPSRERTFSGQQSHKQVWLDAKAILSDSQIKAFHVVRGTHPKREQKAEDLN